MMKVLIVGDVNSVHIIRWVKALSKRGVVVGIFSLGDLNHEEYDAIDNLSINSLGVNKSVFKVGEGNFKKVKYLKAVPALRKMIKEFRPDILHAHYVSSYGLLGALAGFHPYLISVWGSDIYDFPLHNFAFKQIVKYNLSKADKILSTSEVMAVETNKYTDKLVEVTPFGVDVEVFKPIEKNSGSKTLVVGTVKTLEDKYGIDVLIRSFAKVLASEKYTDIVLKIIGEGTKEAELKQLTHDLGIENHVQFVGRIRNDEIPKVLSSFDVYVALSRLDSESFGVAIVEAQACEVPVVVSNKGGLIEVVEKNETGLIVESENEEAAAQAIMKLLESKELRISMGKKGRERVKKLYDWEKNVGLMIDIYENTKQKYS